VNQAAEEILVRGVLESGGSAGTTSADKIVSTFNKYKDESLYLLKVETILSADKIVSTFNKYKDESTGNIEVEGMQKFFEDSGIRDPSDIVTILISSKMNALNMGTFT
jgi:hypothetical protein